MRCIIAGGRKIKSVPLIFKAIESFNLPITEVISGCAGGVDKVGELWAQSKGLPIKRFSADWEDLTHADANIRTRDDGSQYDVRAGGRRNTQMAEYAAPDGHLIAIFDGESRGTSDMIEQAQEHGLQIHIYIVK